jgi:hypothetical protein
MKKEPIEDKQIVTTKEGDQIKKDSIGGIDPKAGEAEPLQTIEEAETGDAHPPKSD